MAHLVLCSVSRLDAPRRAIGVAHVVFGVVVAPAHRDPGSAGQEDRARVAEDALPVDVPVLDVDEPGLGSVGEGGHTAHLLAEVVGMGVDREHVDVHGQDVLVGDDEVAGSRRDVEGAVVLELEQHRKEGGGLGGEVKTDRGPHELGLARGPEVHVEDQVGPRVEGPGHPRWLFVGQGARLPEEEVAVGVEAFRLGRDFHAPEADFGIGGVEPPHRAGAVEQEVRVMTDPGIVQADLDRAYVAGLLDRRFEDQVAEDVGAVGAQGVGLFRGQDEVGLAQRPSRGRLRRRGKISGVPLPGTLLRPIAGGGRSAHR